MTYQLRNREPIMEESLQVAMQRRCKEILGLGLLGTGLAGVAALASYSPQDPGVFNSSSGQIQNLLGLAGAYFASLCMVIVGKASWMLPLFLCVWGFRFLMHMGSDRVILRSIFLPIAVLIGSTYAAALTTLNNWPHNFGLGGMLGDALYSALIYSWPNVFSSYLVFVPFLIIISAIAYGFTSNGLFLGSYWILTKLVGFVGLFFGLKGSNSHPSYSEKREHNLGWMRLFSKKSYVEEQIESEVETEADDYEFISNENENSVRQGLFGIIANALNFGFTLKPELLIKKMREENKVRPAIEPPFTRGGMFDFAPVPDESGVDENEPSSVVKHQKKKRRRKSQQALHEDQPQLFENEESAPHQTPPLALLQDPVQPTHTALSSDSLEQNARLLESVLNDYGIRGEIQEVRPGPVVTLYELMPEPGLKASRVVGLADDIARNMSALSARISTVPGRNVIGIELPNETRETVFLRELISDGEFGDSRMELPIALGKDIGGEPKIVDLAHMPHLLIAGTTGSGKSVAINTMILSLIYRQPPEDCRLIMIDPKMLELSVYDGIPHLLAPVVTDPRKAVVALKWVVAEMEERYRMMSKIGVRKLTTYNERVREAIRQGKKLTRRFPNGFDEKGDQIFCEEESEPNPLPYIVVIVDEMADLMMVAGKEIEACIQRLAQMARASGIHVVMATQRPSVDVITGTVKANFPTRVSFQVSSKIDSRTILNEQGAEQLLGRGDMLYMSGGSQIGRVHGPFVTDKEVEDVVNYLKMLGEPEYLPDVLDEADSSEMDMVLGLSSSSSSADEEYNSAVQIVVRDRKCSTSYIQRRMEIGYNKAARLVERMEEEGLVSAANHVGKREILIPE